MTQAQSEALIDLLILSIFTDSHLSLKEDEALQTALASVEWESTLPRDIFLLNSINRARKASETDAATGEYLTTRAKAFTDAESQQAAVRQIQGVFSGDGMAASESAFLERLRAAF